MAPSHQSIKTNLKRLNKVNVNLILWLEDVYRECIIGRIIKTQFPKKFGSTIGVEQLIKS